MPGTERNFSSRDEAFMRRALELAEKGYGAVSPNPMVGAVIARNGQIVAEGWHARAGEPHAEINAIRMARARGVTLEDAVLYVTLEPCSTFGRTPPCTAAILESGIRRVIVAAVDPNPKHAGAGLSLLREHGVSVSEGLLAGEANRLNETFHHWITTGRPFVALKCAMSLDGKIATNSGESKWITSPRSRRFAMRLRLGADAIAAGINTITRDDPALSLRQTPGLRIPPWKNLRRIILDPRARIPDAARVLNEEPFRTTIVTTSRAPAARIRALRRRVNVIVAPALEGAGGIDLHWLMRELGAQNVTSLLVEGGGETHARFLSERLARRVYFFYAPIIISGRGAPKAVAGDSSLNGGRGLRLRSIEWREVGPDLVLNAEVKDSAIKRRPPE